VGLRSWQIIGFDNWQTVLKTLFVINTLLRRADIKFTKRLIERIYPIRAETFSWPNEPYISRFIQAFATYIQMKLQSFLDLKYVSIVHKVIAGTSFINQYKYKQLTEFVSGAAIQIECLTGCQPAQGLHSIAVGAFRELIKDGLVLWSGLTVGVILLIQQFQSSKLSQQKSIIKMSHSYFKSNSTFKKWCEELVRLQIIERPFLPKSWKAIPRSLVSALEECIS